MRKTTWMIRDKKRGSELTLYHNLYGWCWGVDKVQVARWRNFGEYLPRTSGGKMKQWRFMVIMLLLWNNCAWNFWAWRDLWLHVNNYFTNNVVHPNVNLMPLQGLDFTLLINQWHFSMTSFVGLNLDGIYSQHQSLCQGLVCQTHTIRTMVSLPLDMFIIYDYG